MQDQTTQISGYIRDTIFDDDKVKIFVVEALGGVPESATAAASEIISSNWARIAILDPDGSGASDEYQRNEFLQLIDFKVRNNPKIAVRITKITSSLGCESWWAEFIHSSEPTLDIPDRKYLSSCECGSFFESFEKYAALDWIKSHFCLLSDDTKTITYKKAPKFNGRV